MIGLLRGVLVERDGSAVIVDCSGVGYEVHVSANTLASLPADGSKVLLRVFTHFNPQDTRITLFGFASADERELFDELITVKKVGPTAAIGILSGGIAPVDLARLIASGATSSLMKVRGVGKKTAELIVVELRERCELMLMRWGAIGSKIAVIEPRVAEELSPLLGDVTSALVQMGFKQSEADRAVATLAPTPAATIESLLRQALQAMPR